MIHKFIFFITINFFCLIAVSQNVGYSGIRVVTQKKGTPLPESPRVNSERHKLCFLIKEIDSELRLLFHEFSDGEYKVNERYMEVICHGIIKKDKVLTIEMIPELHNEGSLLKLFINVPGMIRVARVAAKSEDKCIKYLLFDIPEHTVIDSSLPVMLAYEDSRETNEVENLLSKYMKKNGVLPNTEQMLSLLKSKIAQYNLLFYTTKRMISENK